MELVRLGGASGGRSRHGGAVICDTVKGKGVSFIENDYRWHNAHLTEEQFKQAMAEQGVEV